jgi:hypothetical protein
MAEQDKSSSTSAGFIGTLIAIAQIVLGSLSLVECDYGAIFSLTAGCICLGAVFIYIFAYLCGIIISGGKEECGGGCMMFVMISSLIGYTVIEILALVESDRAPDTCPHGFRVSMMVLAGIQVAIMSLLMLSICCGGCAYLITK